MREQNLPTLCLLYHKRNVSKKHTKQFNKEEDC